MRSAPCNEPGLPPLASLGADLLATTRRQRRLALARPFTAVALYALVAYAGLWWLAPAAVFLIFVSVVAVTHDVVHGSLGLSRRQTDWALFATGAVLLESGHAYRATHLRHHRAFPGPDDPEGDPARMSLLKAVAWGPAFLPRLWLWAFARSKPGGAERRWLVAEAAFALLVAIAGVGLCRWTPALLLYTALVVVGSWVYPLLTVHLPHRHYGETPLSQTHTLRGRIVPALFLELTYHLEHHLYPEVPSHNLAELSRRLDPLLRGAGVVPRRVP
jgi:beta-carotene hydroxylase